MPRPTHANLRSRLAVSILAFTVASIGTWSLGQHTANARARATVLPTEQTALLTARVIERDGTSHKPGANPAPEPAPVPEKVPAADGDVRIAAEFDGAPSGTLTAATVRKEFESRGAHVPYAESRNFNKLAVVTDPTGTGKVLQATLAANQLGGVMNFKINITQDGPGHDEAYLSYRLMFGKGFDFSPYGGKLPGLAGGPAQDGALGKDITAGCETVTGD